MICETCKGSGDIVIGWIPASWTSPEEPVTDECPVCLGHGEVRAWELEEFGDVFPSEEEAAEMRWRRYGGRLRRRI